MAREAMIRARTESVTKQRVEQIFDDLGLNMTSALNLFFNQVIHHKGLPFDVRLPNAGTRRAIADARKAIKKPARFKTPEALFESLDS